MATLYPNGFQFVNYVNWNKVKNDEYDYARYGLLTRIMSHTIINTNNPLTKKFLQFYEDSIIFVLKYVDILKHFKDIHWKNR